MYDTLADVYDWLVPEAVLEPARGDEGELEVEVTFDDEGTTHAERLAYWPFTDMELQADLLASGFELVASTFSLEAERYLVTSRANSSNASR